MTPSELLADYDRLRVNLQRLHQVSACAFRRWQEHYARCTQPDCHWCVHLNATALAYECATRTLDGSMEWR